MLNLLNFYRKLFSRTSYALRKYELKDKYLSYKR